MQKEMEAKITAVNGSDSSFEAAKGPRDVIRRATIAWGRSMLRKWSNFGNAREAIGDKAMFGLRKKEYGGQREQFLLEILQHVEPLTAAEQQAVEEYLSSNEDDVAITVMLALGALGDDE